MRIDAPSADTGSAYDLPTPSSDLELVSVGRGTPGGELLRRYWHQIALGGGFGGVVTLPRARSWHIPARARRERSLARIR